MRRLKLRNIFGIVLAAAILWIGTAGTSHAQWGKNTLCPVMPGHAIKEKFFVDYQGERIYFCCRSCVKAFKKHPERYLKNLEKGTHSLPPGP